jgi:nitrous oxidase accessory protein NosD
VLSGNQFENNIQQLSGCVCVDFNVTETKHTWDNGSRGNYWSDYNGTDADSDGIGDTPYVIDVLNEDRYPLMQSTANPPTATLNIQAIIAAVALSAIVAVVAVLVFKRKKKTAPQ